MATTDKLMTADELWRLPPDGQRHELVAGELRTMAPSGSEHGWIVVRVTIPLGQHVEAHRLGLVYGAETGFLLPSRTVEAPGVPNLCGPATELDVSITDLRATMRAAFMDRQRTRDMGRKASEHVRGAFTWQRYGLLVPSDWS